MVAYARAQTDTKWRPIMSRYYFHLTDGECVPNNHKGIDLSGKSIAREG